MPLAGEAFWYPVITKIPGREAQEMLLHEGRRRITIETRPSDSRVLPRASSAGVFERGVGMCISLWFLREFWCRPSVEHPRNQKQFNLGHVSIIGQDQRVYLHLKHNIKWLPSCWHWPMKSPGAALVYSDFLREPLTVLLNDNKKKLKKSFLS